MFITVDVLVVLLMMLCSLRDTCLASGVLRHQHIGCYRDNKENRVMGSIVIGSPSMTIELCSQTCRNRTSTFFGVQYGTECMCGESYDRLGPASNCDMACSGNSAQICGGSNALNIYWVCPEGSYGSRCTQSCHCLNNTRYSEHCFRNGTCPAGCQPGWTGTTCSTEMNECSSNPCQHGGICTDRLHGYTCSCSPGYTGSVCQTDINECFSRPCQHGGTCQDQVNRYTCRCVPGYTGVNCQTDINECSSKPCKNEGRCADQVNHYTCRCVPGYTGVNCQTEINECSSNPCKNIESCTDQLNGYTCSCAPGYTGTDCQTDIDECYSTPCQNGGRCIDEVNGFSCCCVDGYAGVTCEAARSDTTVKDVSALRTTSIVLGVLSAVLAVILIAVLVICGKRNANLQRQLNEFTGHIKAHSVIFSVPNPAPDSLYTNVENEQDNDAMNYASLDTSAVGTDERLYEQLKSGRK